MVMIWVSLYANGPAIVHFIACTMDQQMYLNILKVGLQLCKQKLWLGENFYFDLDNGPKSKHCTVIVNS